MTVTRAIDLPALTFRAAVHAVRTDRTADLVFSTGAGVLRRDESGPYLEQLSLHPAHVRLARLNAGAPVLNAHAAFSLADQIGVVVDGSAAVDGVRGRARVRFSRRADVDPIFEDVRERIIQNVSVGYRVHVFEESEGADGLRVYTATDWEPFEISLVPMGADPGARIRAALELTNRCAITRALSTADADRGRRLRLAQARAITW